MRVKLDRSHAAADLVGFLRSFDCRVSAESGRLVEVEFERPPPATVSLALVRAGRCYGCGGEIAAALAELGSPRCHDCRDGADGRAELDRIRLEAFIGVWNALHPAERATVLDERRATG